MRRASRIGGTGSRERASDSGWVLFLNTAVYDPRLFGGGEAMTIGYLTLNTVTLDNASTSSGFDNWLVTVKPIPAPDADGDGVLDDADNCVLAANGPPAWSDVRMACRPTYAASW